MRKIAKVPIEFIYYLDPVELRVWAFIKANRGATWQEISRRLCMSRSGVFRVLKNLKDKAFVARQEEAIEALDGSRITIYHV